MKNINSLCIKDALLLLWNWLKEASRKRLALPLPGGGQLKHRLSDCQSLPTPQWSSNNTKMLALAPSAVAFQLLGTWKENRTPWLSSHTYTQKQKPEAYFTCPSWRQPWIAWFRRIIELATNCVSCCPTSETAKAPGRVAVDHILVAPACFHELYCPLEGSLCLWAAVWSRLSLCTVSPRRPRLTVPCDIVSSGIFWGDWWFSSERRTLSWRGAESGKDSVWLLLEPTAAGQLWPHPFGSLRQPNGSGKNI